MSQSGYAIKGFLGILEKLMSLKKLEIKEGSVDP